LSYSFCIQSGTSTGGHSLGVDIHHMTASLADRPTGRGRRDAQPGQGSELFVTAEHGT